MKKQCGKKIKVVNIGLQSFAESLQRQGVEVAHINWRPRIKHDKEMEDLLDSLI